MGVDIGKAAQSVEKVVAGYEPAGAVNLRGGIDGNGQFFGCFLRPMAASLEPDALGIGKGAMQEKVIIKPFVLPLPSLGIEDIESGSDDPVIFHVRPEDFIKTFAEATV